MYFCRLPATVRGIQDAKIGIIKLLYRGNENTILNGFYGGFIYEKRKALHGNRVEKA